MLQALMPMIGLVAAAAWIVAAVSLISALRLVPAGHRLSALFSAGWWQFDKVRALGGAGVDRHIVRYGWAFAVFFLAIVAAMLVGILLSVGGYDVAASGPAIS